MAENLRRQKSNDTTYHTKGHALTQLLALNPCGSLAHHHCCNYTE